MKEKELRIALVCFGGVSLAVYMHGVSREILKLVRASKALHDIPGHAARLASSYPQDPAARDGEVDTEPFYYELLREIGQQLDLRVVVDIIAGASAGGINGTMLARALSHDLPTGQLRDLWLEKADIGELLSPEARPGRWSKLILRPAIWLLGALGRSELARDAEVRTKLSLFLRSRWFKPPLDGARMTAFMYDALMSMGEPANAGASLLPPGQRLDLFVSLTDFYGWQQPIHIHDPSVIHDREHRLVLHFTYRQATSGAIESDFDTAHAPGLAFAARATSSFPGAFPPAQITEVDRLLRARRIAWPGRGVFFDRHFEPYARVNIDPAGVSFIDGGVLSNRPFHEAIRAIVGRPAYRQIDRRLLYVDPDPAHAEGAFRRSGPGFFATLKGALSDIPRVEPVTEELGRVAAYNQQVQRLRNLMEGTRPQVSQFVADIMAGGRPPAMMSAQQLRTWRSIASSKAWSDAGFAYEGYVGLKLASVRAFLSQLIVLLRGIRPESPFAFAIAAVIDAWAEQTRHVYQSGEQCPFPIDAHAVIDPQAEARLPRWLRFLADFDLDFRKRRLHLLIEGQNRRYGLADEGLLDDAAVAEISKLKRTLYEHLERLRQRELLPFYSRATREAVETVFPMAPTPLEMGDLPDYTRRYVERHAPDIERLLPILAQQLALTAETRALDAVLAARHAERPAALSALLSDYVGFPFWDVLTFPVMTWREAGEFNEIRIDRISPQDARSFQGLSTATRLKGLNVGHFAGLFSRGYRENDYLLGRLHAAERLIDIVSNAAVAHAGIDVAALKKRCFTRIVDAEAPGLTHSAPLIAELRTWIAQMADAGTARGT